MMGRLRPEMPDAFLWSEMLVSRWMGGNAQQGRAQAAAVLSLMVSRVAPVEVDSAIRLGERTLVLYSERAVDVLCPDLGWSYRLLSRRLANRVLRAVDDGVRALRWMRL